MHQARDDPRTGLILIGFSPPDRLSALARHLGWPGAVLADQQRILYQRLGIGRAPVWRVYSPRTLAFYTSRAILGHPPARPVEDTRQLGADAIMTEGVIRLLWRPRTPSDRPAAADVTAAAGRWLGGLALAAQHRAACRRNRQGRPFAPMAVSRTRAE